MDKLAHKRSRARDGENGRALEHIL